MAVALLVMALAAAAALLRLLRAERDCAKRQLLRSMHGARSGPVGQIGLSLLLADGISLRRLERLLSVEYALFEVVAVLDAAREEELFGMLVARYRLIRVGYRPTGELPVSGVQALYRSRKRRFRRLVLVDRRENGLTPPLHAAVEAAAYDFLWPLRPDERLTRGAVERAVYALSEAAQPPVILRSVSGLRATIYGREAVAAAGGFTRELRRRARPRITIRDPLTVRREEVCGGWRSRWLRWFGAGLGVAVLAAGIAAAPAWWWAAAWTATLLLLALCRVRIGQLHRACG